MYEQSIGSMPRPSICADKTHILVSRRSSGGNAPDMGNQHNDQMTRRVVRTARFPRLVGFHIPAKALILLRIVEHGLRPTRLLAERHALSYSRGAITTWIFVDISFPDVLCACRRHRRPPGLLRKLHECHGEVEADLMTGLRQR